MKIKSMLIAALIKENFHFFQSLKHLKIGEDVEDAS